MPPQEARRPDLSRLDRNLDALVHELAARCNSIFSGAAQAAARSAIVTHPSSVATPASEGVSKAAFVRERLVAESEVRSLSLGALKSTDGQNGLSFVLRTDGTLPPTPRHPHTCNRGA